MLEGASLRMTPHRDSPSEPPEPGNAGTRGLYLMGAAASGLTVFLAVAHTGVFFAAGLPEGVEDWFALFGRSRLLGLLAFELLMVGYVLASLPVALALFAATRQRSPTLAALFLACSIVGAVLFIAARPAFEMLALGEGFAAASTEPERQRFLAAGQAALAIFHGTAFWVSYALGSLGGLLLAAAMLRSRLFGSPAPALRAASSVLDWGLFVPGIGLYLSLVSVLCLLAFNGLTARRLVLLARPIGRPK